MEHGIKLVVRRRGHDPPLHGAYGNREPHHRLPGNFFNISILLQNKKSLFPNGEQGQKIHFCGTTLFAGMIRPLCPVPTHRLPVNAGIASEDTLGCPISPCPRRPICCSAFRPALSSAGLSVDALAVLLPRLRFSLWMTWLYYIIVPLSSTKFRPTWKDGALGNQFASAKIFRCREK